MEDEEDEEQHEQVVRSSMYSSNKGDDIYISKFLRNRLILFNGLDNLFLITLRYYMRITTRSFVSLLALSMILHTNERNCFGAFKVPPSTPLVIPYNIIRTYDLSKKGH